MRYIPTYKGNVPPKDELVELCKNMTLDKIAEHYQTYEKKVWYWIRKYDLKPVRRAKGGYRKSININIEYVQNLLDKGYKMKEISTMLNVSEVTLRKKLRESEKKVDDEKDSDWNNGGFNCRYSEKGGKHDCIYWSRHEGVCDYLLKTGKRRPCPANSCTVYESKAGDKRQ